MALDLGAARRVLVVGDLMLDVRTEGQAARLAPEAPVPVVVQSRRSHRPGGAGNVAVNLARLGEKVQILAAVGADPEGRLVRAALAGLGVDERAVVTMPGPTTVKHRVIAGGQQLLRLDVEQTLIAPKELIAAAVEQLRRCLPDADVLVLSDYAKGLCTAQFCAQAIDLAVDAGIPVVIDPKGVDYSRYRGATVITPNLTELRQALQPGGGSSPIDRARALVADLGCAVLVTKGADGMSLFEPGGQDLHLPALARVVRDVTGAGDTVAAVLAALLARGVDLRSACSAANACAALVVGQPGTASVSREELMVAAGRRS